MRTGRSIPSMPEGFTDRTAWDAIHYKFSPSGGIMDAAVLDWQRDNQERVKAAINAEINSGAKIVDEYKEDLRRLS